MIRDESDAIDARLLADGRLGDVLARHLEDLRNRAKMRMPAADAEDAVQVALLRVVREVQAGRVHPVPIRVVLHKVLDWTMGAMWSSIATGPALVGLDELDLPGNEEDGFAEVETRLWFDDVLTSLPDRVREVMRLRFTQGLEIEEVAAELGIDRNAVDQALFRGRLAIRESLSRG